MHQVLSKSLMYIILPGIAYVNIRARIHSYVLLIM